MESNVKEKTDGGEGGDVGDGGCVKVNGALTVGAGAALHVAAVALRAVDRARRLLATGRRLGPRLPLQNSPVRPIQMKLTQIISSLKKKKIWIDLFQIRINYFSKFN